MKRNGWKPEALPPKGEVKQEPEQSGELHLGGHEGVEGRQEHPPPDECSGAQWTGPSD